MERRSEPAALPVRVFPTRAEAERAVAGEIAELVARASAPVLGLATGTTPVGIYAELVRLRAAGELDLARVETFNLDEYLGVPPEHPGSFRAFMRRHLFDPVGLPPERTHLLRGDVPPPEVAEHCAAYEEAIRAAGGIDLQLVGIGGNGHVAFNEPGAARDSRTRRVTLAEATRTHYAASFDGDPPTEALTMGVATILEARRLVAVAFGAGKAEIVARALAEPVGPELPATFLREHPRAELVLDAPAAARLDLGGRA